MLELKHLERREAAVLKRQPLGVVNCNLILTCVPHAGTPHHRKSLPRAAEVRRVKLSKYWLANIRWTNTDRHDAH